MGQDVDRFFNKNYESALLIDKGNYRGYLNLSSNESHHKGYFSLFSEFIHQFVATVLRCMLRILRNRAGWGISQEIIT